MEEAVAIDLAGIVGAGPEHRFERFAECLPGLAWIKDLEGRYVYANGEAQRTFAKYHPDVIGKTDEEVFPKEIAEQFTKNDKEALHAGPEGIRVIEKLEHKDGLIHHSIVTKFPLFDESGRPSHVAGTAIDITAQKFAEDKLSAMLSSIGDHLVCFDRNWRYTHVNDTVLIALGKTREELIGQCVWELFPDRIGNQFYREVHEAFNEQKVIRSESYYEPFDKWYENHIYPNKDGVTVYTSDITWRKKMEQELQRRTDELSIANKRKDEFLAMLGHELRNPLAPLSNALQLLRLAQGDKEAFERTREIMERQVHQMARLIDDLLDVGRITRGRLELKKEPLDLLEPLQRAVEGSMPLIEAMGHKLEVDAPEGPIPVLADASRLAQIFTNLLNNAARYTPPGGHIWLGVKKFDSLVEVSVRDDGRGMSPENLSEVFEMFVQLNREAHEAKQGLGLGLTLVKRLAELHGGKVEAKSPGLGKGSEFVVTLPLGEAPETRAPRTRTAPENARPERVLVVDDNFDSANTMAMLMQSFGHESRVCHDGVEALREAIDYEPDVVLLDIGLPGLSGYEVARRIRMEPWGSTALLIAVTGWGHEEDKRRALEAGFDYHMTKPLSLEDLKSTLERWREPAP